jgi:F-type H+-transporting ATPase subunit epsilon
VFKASFPCQNSTILARERSRQFLNGQEKTKFLKKSIFIQTKTMTLQVCIMTPDRIFWNDQADEIILPTNTGQMGVLTNHAPLITALDIGVTLIRSTNNLIPVALMGGFALVKQNQVTILVNEAESAQTISVDEAEQVFQEAKTRLEESQGEKQRVEATFIFKRARARYQVVKQLSI